MSSEVEGVPVPQLVEEVSPGLTLRWFNDKRVLVYEITSATGETLNIWADTVIKTLEAWSPDQPYLAIHDLSSRGVGLSYAVKVQYNLLNIGITPSGRERADLIMMQRPQFSARVALVFSSTFSGNLGQTFAMYNRLDQTLVQYKVYFDREQAFAWLTEAIEG